MLYYKLIVNREEIRMRVPTLLNEDVKGRQIPQPDRLGEQMEDQREKWTRRLSQRLAGIRGWHWIALAIAAAIIGAGFVDHLL